jgi:hypothetical protein
MPPLEDAMMKPVSRIALLAVMLALAACARQAPDAVNQAASTPGFWWGLWHGFIFPFSWIGSLFRSDIAVYAVPNSGGWYDFGFFLGVFVLGGGGHYGNSKRRRRG